ncbi:prepilin peptidase [Enterococcus sp. LJL99]
MLSFIFITGCVMGSFFSLVAERLPLGKSILTPRSHCTYCKQPLQFFELIPLFSIILQKFRCRYCKRKISTLYFFSEFLCGLLFCYSFIGGFNFYTCYRLLFLLMAYVLSLTDLLYLIVEPKILFISTALLCFFHLYLSFPIHFFTAGALFIGLSLFNLNKKEQLGGGDILLISIWGLFLGSFPLTILLLVASVSGLLFILIFKYVLGNSIIELPFVPFLSIGLFIVFHFFLI